ncbi:MAG: hypothetical protein NTY57_01995 [Solirubrobacterales bacterium]|nr:hypothetical protein [Solirubrobacterales bacterium]
MNNPIPKTVIAMCLSVAAVLASPVSASAGSSAPPTITVNSMIQPAFSASFTDYAVKCPEGTITVNAQSPSRTSVSIDGSPRRSGTVSQAVQVSPGQEFTWTVYRIGWHAATYHARCIPESMILPTTTRTGTVQSEFYFASPQALSFASVPTGYDSILLDRNGAPVWWYNTAAPSFFPQLASPTTFRYFRGTEPPLAVGSGRGVWETRTLSGNLVSTLAPTDGTADFHELASTKAGTYYTAGYTPRSQVDMSPWGGPSDSSVVDSIIREIRADGSTAWSWRSQDHIPLADMGRWGSAQVTVSLSGVCTTSPM